LRPLNRKNDSGEDNSPHTETGKGSRAVGPSHIPHKKKAEKQQTPDGERKGKRALTTLSASRFRTRAMGKGKEKKRASPRLRSAFARAGGEKKKITEE